MAIVTINCDFDEHVSNAGSENTSSTLLFIYSEGSGLVFRAAIRFPLDDVSDADSVAQVEFLCDANSAFSVGNVYIGPYNGDGQADPSADAGATAYSRCDTSSDNYGGALADLDTTGPKVIDLGATAAADLEAAIAAGNRFTLAIRLVTETGNRESTLLSLDDSNPPRIRVTYTPTGDPEPEPEPDAEPDGEEFEEFDAMDQTELSIWNRALSRCGDYRLTFGSAKTVSGATAANPVVMTSTAHGLVEGDLVVATQFDEMTQLNGRVFRVENETTNTFELADENGSSYTAETTGGIVRKLTASSNKQAKALFDAWPNLRDEVLRDHPWNCTMKYTRLARLQTATTITGATAANPVVITTSGAHGYSQGDLVLVDRVVGMTELNDRWFTVGTVPSATTFQLSGIDGTDYTAYSSAGRAQKALTPFTPDFDYAYRYTLPTDCLDLVELANLSRDDWEVIEDRTVYTDAGPTVPIRYVRRNRDTTQYDPLLRSLLAARLAYEIVAELVESNTKKEMLRKDWEEAERKAKVRDAQEHSVSDLAPDEWERARL